MSFQLSLGNCQTRGKLENLFWDYHLANPSVFIAFRSLANEWRKRKGDDAQLSIAMLFERARWELDIDLGDQAPKLCNNHKPFYARLLMDRCPELEGIFILKRLKVPCSFGPENFSLGPNAGNNPTSWG